MDDYRNTRVQALNRKDIRLGDVVYFNKPLRDRHNHGKVLALEGEVGIVDDCVSPHSLAVKVGSGIVWGCSPEMVDKVSV